MPVFATDTQRLSNLVKKANAQLELLSDKVTAYEASAATYDVGTVLGKITASGKYTISKKAAADGSQVPAAVVIWDRMGDAHQFSVAATTDTPVVALVRGIVEVADGALKLDSSWSTNADKLSVYASLKSVGILVESQA